MTTVQAQHTMTTIQLQLMNSTAIKLDFVRINSGFVVMCKMLLVAIAFLECACTLILLTLAATH